jgi:hypothetical protein
VKRSSVSFLLLSALFAGLVPTLHVVGQSSGAPACFGYVYLPLALSGSSGSRSAGQERSLASAMRTRHTADITDFNGDGCADLAIGVPGEDLGSGERHGQVNVVYGSAHGLAGGYNQVWHRDGGYAADGSFLSDLQDLVSAIDEFGAALATGDFDQDGYTDLAIGVPNSNVGGRVNAGAVQVIYGSSAGLVAADNQHWSQRGGWVDNEGDGTGVYTGDIYGGPEDDDRFGAALP